MTTPHGCNRVPTSGAASARLVELLFCLDTFFQNDLGSFLQRSLARMAALIEASLRLHWRSKYLNLDLEVVMSLNTSPCLGLLDIIQHLKASLASECAALTKSFHPGVMFLSLRQFDFELGI